jgi:hypothetical protein
MSSTWIESPTPEGLLVTETPAGDGSIIVREFLRPGSLVHEYRYTVRSDSSLDVVSWNEDVHVLLKHTQDLIERAAEARLAPVDTVDMARLRRDAKVAKRRLRRWIREHDHWVVQVRPEYHDLVKRVLKEKADAPIDYLELFDRAVERGEAVAMVVDYERRKLERPVIVVDSLPHALSHLLQETVEAYCHGLFRATAAICRSALERMVDLVLDVHPSKVTAVPYTRSDLEASINCVPEEFLSAKGRTLAHDIRVLGNKVLHRAHNPSEAEAWRALVLTARLAEAITNRGGFSSDR